MALRRALVTVSLGALIWAAVPAAASADWLFTPFIGTTFGGSADIGGQGGALGNDFDRRVTYGASLMSGGAVGFELDFGYSPNFFNTTSDGLAAFSDSNVTTLMANLKLGASGGAVQPYVVGGVGLIRSRVDDITSFITDNTTNDFGFDVGGGINAFFNRTVGIRGDVRFFRSFQDVDPNGVDLKLGSFKFWRGTAGVTFRF
jgi:Outer membrane protein beta-barrel domain